MKVALAALFLCFVLFGFAQNQNADTTLKKDTSITEILNNVQDNMPTVTLSDEDLNDDGSNSYSVSSILGASRNPFLSAAAFSFSPARFRLRSYENADATYLNGIDFTGLDNGFTPYGLWTGLTNVMRSRENAYGLEPNNYAIGNIGLNSNIDLRAGAQWAQTQIGYAFSNRNYQHRIIFTHGSGFNEKGWAYALMLSPRYANEGYVPGTYYRSLSYYGAVDKKLNERNTLSLIAFGAPTENGRQGPSTQEAMDLAGTNYYNPAWGYQNGKKRNSNVAETFQPAFMGIYDHRPSNKTSWITSVAYTFGKRKTSGLDWFNAPDPRPDYYRYLPSYYDSTQIREADELRRLMKSRPEMLQVNWGRLYDVNRGNVQTVTDENGNAVTGMRSLYILSNRVIDQKRFIINSVYNTRINNLGLMIGANFQKQLNEYYQEVKDLLGGDYFVNLNQFAQRAYPQEPTKWQNDLNHPDRIVRNGEKYGYDYKIDLNRAAAWAQGLWTLRKFDFFIGSELSFTSYYRNGLNRNGLFDQESFGKSKKLNFVNTSTKGGITYKYNGRNYFFVNGAYITNPPLYDNVFTSPRTRNALQDTITSEAVQTLEAGYKFMSPRIKLILNGYYTNTRHGYDVRTFYYDDEQFQDFINYALSGIDKVFFGGELGIEAKLTSTLTFHGAASVGRAYYDSRQTALVTIDNSGVVLPPQKVYLQNYRIPSTPQNAYSAGLFYRSPKYWYISLTGNYFSNMWVDPAPSRRTQNVFDNLDPSDARVQAFYNNLIKQEEFDPQFTLDFFGGWSKRLPKKYYINNKASYLVFNLGVNNLLNNTTIRSGGFEQARFDNDLSAGYLNANKFPNKYYYAYGLNYYASVMFRFN